MGEFHQFLTELSAGDMSVFSFQDNNFSKYQWIFTKLCICIAVVEIWFGIYLMGEFRQFLTRVICLGHVLIFVSGQ